MHVFNWILNWIFFCGFFNPEFLFSLVLSENDLNLGFQRNALWIMASKGFARTEGEFRACSDSSSG